MAFNFTDFVRPLISASERSEVNKNEITERRWYHLAAEDDTTVSTLWPPKLGSTKGILPARLGGHANIKAGGHCGHCAARPNSMEGASLDHLCVFKKCFARSPIIPDAFNNSQIDSVTGPL